MKIIGLMPVRNEAWCLGLTARAALMWCDELVILDHASTDGTRAIIFDLLGDFTGRVVHESIEGEWLEMLHRQFMLSLARIAGATHIAIIDCDEILTGNRIGHVREYVQECISGYVMHLPGYNLRGSVDRYHLNGIWGNRWFSTAFKDDPRLSWSGDKFHSREPQGVELKPYKPIAQGQGGIMHLWGASERRLRAKSALYKLTERLRWPDRPIPKIDEMYSWAIKGSTRKEEAHFGTPATWIYRETPAEWWEPYVHLMHHLEVDAEPWQEAECRRLVAEHGAPRFAGLDLFGCAT